MPGMLVAAGSRGKGTVRDGWVTDRFGRDWTPRSTGHIGGIDLHQHLALSPTSPRSARGMVRTALADCRGSDVRDTAELLTSELVTNALLHAGTDLTVHVELHDPDGAVRIAVEDGSGDAPALGSLDMVALGGRGLPLVAALADRWGWDRLPHGKRVWFEV